MQFRRREFLGAVATMALFYGVGRLTLGGAAPPAPPRPPDGPPWLLDAIAELKDNARPGIAIVLPEDAAGRATLLAELDSLVRSTDVATRTCLVEAVYVVAAAERIGARPGETAVLLGSDGRRVAGTNAVLTSATFVSIVRPLLRDNDPLAMRVSACSTGRTPALLSRLDSGDLDAHHQAVAELANAFENHGPALIASMEALPPGEARTRREHVLALVYDRRRGTGGDHWERPLPFGTEWDGPTLTHLNRTWVIDPRLHFVPELRARPR